MSQRLVPMSQPQYDALNDHIIPSLMRAELTEMASLMMTLALAYKWAAEPIKELPPNVYPLVTHAGDDWSRKVIS
jgi:hypothetical protein